MAKVNVFQNERAAVEYESFGPFFEPEDEKNPLKHYTFRLRSIDPIEKIAAKRFGDLLTARYCTGGYANENGDFREGAELMAFGPNSDIIETTPELMQFCAEVEWMQGIKRELFAEDPSLYEGYTAREICVIGATAANVWEELRFAVRKKRTETYQKKTKASDTPSPTPESPAE